MQKPYAVKCLSAKYDVAQKMLVLSCFFEDFGGQRIVHFHKSDFHYKEPGIEVPDKEMHKTAELFRGKRFKLVIEDDPDRKVDVNYNAGSERSLLKSAFSNTEKAIEAKLGNLDFRI